MTRGTVRLATRGSDLARRQAAGVADALENRRYEAELVEVSTRGDEIRDELIHRLGKTGAFVRALDERVLDGDADAAVHSMKDMPTEAPPDLVVAGVPERASPADVLVTPDGSGLNALPEGAVVGTASMRRGAAVRSRRSDLRVEPIRGNVDTRVEKLLAPSVQREHQRRMEAEEGDSNDDTPEFERSVDDWMDDLNEVERRALGWKVNVEYDALVMAEAGLDRSGLSRRVPTDRFAPTEFVPAPGQGAIAVTALDGDTADALNEVLDHPRTRVETTVERTVLATLGGGCIAPVGVYAVVQGEHVRASASIRDPEGDRKVQATQDLPVERHVDAARSFANDLADRGAAELVAAAREGGGAAPDAADVSTNGRDLNGTGEKR